MPDPTAHADDMKSPAVIEPNTSPAFWWVNPWGYAINLKRALDAVHLLSETTEDAYQAAKHVIKQKEELADYHRNNLNSFQRKVELTLKPACPHLYEDTIGYVQWAADEIKSLRVLSSGMKEDRDAYIEKVKELREEQQGLLHEARVAIANNEVNEGNIEQLEARLDAKQAFIEICQGRIAKLEGKKKPKAKRKPAKKKAKYGDARDGYAALARKVLKGLAKKKGGRK